MKFKKLLNISLLTAMLAGVMTLATSCKDPETTEDSKTGKVTGMVTDVEKAPLANVTVKIGELTAQTDASGAYTIEKVDMTKTSSVSFTKTDYLSTSKTLTKDKFVNGVATINAELEFAAAKIGGTVTDAANDNAPIEGVLVKINDSQNATTDAAGKYLIENLQLTAYELEFSKTGYATVTKSVGLDQFVNNLATVDCAMGATEVLPDMTADDLASADKWLYNEYRGGRNGDDYPHWDWSVDNMCTLSFVGWYQEQSEGTTLQIRNSEEEGHWSNPADLDNFDSYIYGSKMITADNKILTVRIRTHGADEASPAIWGVQVADLSAAEPVAVKIGENKTYGSEDYSSFEFDLSEYVGKEIIVAVGIYRGATGDYWKQVCLRRISFAPEFVPDWNWMPGTEVSGLSYDGWKMTQEIVRSTMVQTATSFTGIPTVNAGGNGDNYYEAYRSWRENNGIGYCWTIMPVQKDAEPIANEGFLIKTRGSDAIVSTVNPQAYIYAKFDISDANDHMVMKLRNFDSGNATYFKVTAIDEDMNVTHFKPTTMTAASSGEGADNCTWYMHEDGGADNVDAYATAEFDLSSLKGKKAVVAIGVFKGVANDGENKMVIHSINLD